MKLAKKLAAGAAAVAISATFGATAYAQVTTSDVSGVVSNENGAPVANAMVTIVNTDTGLARTTTTDVTGRFNARNLPVGGEYEVFVTADGYQGQRSEEISLFLGETTELTFDLDSAATDEILVIGKRDVTADLAVGPNASFDLETMKTVPAVNRNITDVLRIDPRVYVDESRGSINAVQCAGKNPRFNSLTVDGVRMNDSFGLNSNGYPTERMPFSFDSIEQVSVELAPFDVQYGGFSACNINAVTKSGGNTLSGNFFIDYSNNDLRGDSLEGDDITTGDYDDYSYGIAVGFPILKDKLFGFVSYEKYNGANLFDRGAEGSGTVNEVEITQAELDEILDIARTLYQYDPGEIPNSADNEDEKILVKLDWNINDFHRAAFTYNYNDGFNISQSDGDDDEFEFSNHLYERGAELNSYAGSLYSDWTDNFSTEVRLSYLELDNRQISVGGTDFAEIRIETDDVDVYIGGDDSRQSNKLNYDLMSMAFKGIYDVKGHQLTFGFEREQLDIFNLFVQHTETEIRFDGIDNFRNGFADAIYYNNAPSNNSTDAAADWGYGINTLYLQDNFDWNDRLNITAGLRYDWYTSDDKPEENADFVADYGFSNSTNLDGEGLVQPRLGFTYDHADNLIFTGGLGLYSGGNPNVWLSNNFSANNVLQFGQRGRSFGYTDGSRSLFDTDIVWEGCEEGVPVGPGYCIPGELYDAVASGVGDNFEINYLDPDFKLPSEWKASLGVTWIPTLAYEGFMGGEYAITADLLWSKGKDTAIVKRGDLEQVGTTAEGYPIYDSVREASFVLTNSSVGNESFGASFAISKEYDNGLDWTFGYAYSDAKDVQPMTSSVAFSNYTNRAFFDPQEEVLSTSNYNIANRFTLLTNYEREFFGDNLTRFSAFGQLNEGRPYSIGFNGTIDPYSFTPYLDFGDQVLRPGVERNSFAGPWWGKVDVKLTQEFPGAVEGHKSSAFIAIDNFTNMLNDDWGVLYQADFPRTVNELDTTPTNRVGDASRYEIRIGAEYNF